MFVRIILICCLLIGGWMVFISPGSGACGMENRTGPLPGLLLADRSDAKDRITYSTDPEMDRATAEEEKEEKEKEDKSWMMLQHMNIYKGTQKPAQSGNPARPAPNNSN